VKCTCRCRRRCFDWHSADHTTASACVRLTDLQPTNSSPLTAAMHIGRPSMALTATLSRLIQPAPEHAPKLLPIRRCPCQLLGTFKIYGPRKKALRGGVGRAGALSSTYWWEGKGPGAAVVISACCLLAWCGSNISIKRVIQLRCIGSLAGRPTREIDRQTHRHTQTDSEALVVHVTIYKHYWLYSTYQQAYYSTQCVCITIDTTGSSI